MKFSFQKEFLSILFTFTLISCSKDEKYLPNTNVYHEIYLSDVENRALWVDDGWKYLSGGIRGILLYRKNEKEYLAFERNCTWQSKDSCAVVEADSSGLYMICRCCSSRFKWDGSVLKQPATMYLKQYATELNTNNVLLIYN